MHIIYGGDVRPVLAVVKFDPTVGFEYMHSIVELWLY